MATSALTQAELQGLLERRNAAVAKCREIVAKAEVEKRVLTAEEEEEWNRWENEARQAADAYKSVINHQKRLEWLEEAAQELENPVGGRVTDPAAHISRSIDQGQRKEIAWNPTDAFSKQFQLRHATRSISLQGIRAHSRYHEAFSRYLATGSPGYFEKLGFTPDQYQAEPQNSLRSDDEERGGYFIASEEFVAGLLKNVDDATFVQRLSRVFTVRNARSLGIHKRVSKFRAWNWGSELHDVSEHLDESLKYGKRSLFPHYISGAARISRDLLRTGTMPVEAMVLEEASIDLAETLEEAYLYGDGAQKPLGVMVASPEGISTARDVRSIDADVNTSAGEDSTTHWGFNTLIRAKYALKPQYRNRARWMFHRDAMARIAMIRDNNGQYIWQPSKVVGDPDMILGLPADESEWMPNTFSADNYFGLLADWQYYWIAFGMELEVLRLTEIRARQNQVEYLMRLKVDAMPVLEEAFVRLQLASV